MNFKYISLFSGIGGFESALNNLGGQCVMASEIDKYAEISYQALYGHSTIGDITKVDGKDVPDHDLLVGGFPCQAFSVAGKRRGFEDARGTLFFEALRIAKHKQPKAILLENVKGLVSHDKGRTLDIMISSLSEIGYTVDFDILNSKYFGVPQNRERIFIVAIRDDLVKTEEWNIVGKNIVAKGKQRLSQHENLNTLNFSFPSQDEVTTRLKDVLELKVDDKYYLSEEKTANLVAQLEEGVAIKEATKQGYAIATVGDAVNFQFPDSNTRRGRVGKQIANTLEASNINQGVVERTDRIIEVGKLREHRNSSLMNTVHSTEGISSALDTMQGGGREPKIAEAPSYRIRKLTPLECWRLQGFTDEQFYKAKNAGLSDSQLYKQAGNAVTVNVIEAIAKELLNYIK